MKGDLVEGEHRVGRRELWGGARSVGGQPLDRYRRDGVVSDAQYRAGLRVHRDWQRGRSSKRLVALYGERQSGGQGELSDADAASLHAYVMAMNTLGPELAPVIVHVVLMGDSAQSWGEAKGKRGVRAKEHGTTTLCLALDRLVRHYQLTAKGYP